MNVRGLSMAFTMALVVSAGCTYILNEKITARAAEHAPERRYMVAARVLQAGEVLKADDLTLVPWPAGNPIAGAFSKPEELLGRAMLYPTEKGQPITERMVSAPGAGAGLAGKIRDGMRAVALRTDEVMGVAGFLLPGSRVDVLATYRTDKSPEPETTTVLQNAEVLAAGHQVQPDPEGKPAAVTVVTLLLSPADAEKAVLASTQGTVHFVMRSGSDQRTMDGKPVMLSELSKDASSDHAVQLAVNSQLRGGRHRTTDVYTVETVLGDKQTTQTFRVPR